MYTIEIIINKLKIYNDSKFHFDEQSHIYTYDDKPFISVTTFLSRFHKPFDSDFWSKRNAKRDGIAQEEVLKSWKEKSDKACDLVTEVHLWIENYFSNVIQELVTNLDVIERINKFNLLYGKYLYKLSVIKCEQMIFSKNKIIAGMIDSLFLYKGNVIMLDWKTNGKMSSDEDTTYNKLLYPFTKYW